MKQVVLVAAALLAMAAVAPRAGAVTCAEESIARVRGSERGGGGAQAAGRGGAEMRGRRVQGGLRGAARGCCRAAPLLIAGLTLPRASPR